ncbi:hypothetical protein JTF08_06460 [Micrococcaceae bacterium RIT802]|nr:hypothetical protein [Micrococcaceae bacterium RIT 802]
MCAPQTGGNVVLYNNTQQVWAIDPSLPANVHPGTSLASEATFFRNYVAGRQAYMYLMPGEIALPAGPFPRSLPWAPEPALTPAWVSQRLALENLQVSADSGNLEDGLVQYVRSKQVSVTNPVVAALQECVRSAYDVGKRAAEMGDQTEFIDKLQLALDGTQSASRCARAMDDTSKDAEEGRAKWLRHVQRSAGQSSDGVDVYQAIQPVVEHCQALRVIPRVGTSSGSAARRQASMWLRSDTASRFRRLAGSPETRTAAFPSWEDRSHGRPETG